jgi:hypothetical protein
MHVWMGSLHAENTRILVWKNQCFFCAKVNETDPAVWEERMREARDPTRELGPECEVARLQDVTRVEAAIGFETRIYYDNDGPKVMRITMPAGGQEVRDLVKEHHPDWRLDVTH